MDATPGTLVADRFLLEKELGKGGMGTVWRARHTGLDIPCAVKLIREDAAASPEVRARFEREAKAAAQLRSPHVVQILDHGVWNDLPYIAMELLEGEELEDRLKRLGKLPPAEVADITAQVCRALTKAHGMGLVHRDLKPANVFLSKDGDREIAKILDFGIVKDTSGSGPTKAGTIMGTPYYMSPEQARSAKSIDPRADLWSLAVMVFRAVTGQLPFTAESFGDLLMKILSGPIPVPSQIAAVPAGFDAWWQKAASRDPGGRFQSATELAEALTAAVAAPVPQVAAQTSPPVTAGGPPSMGMAPSAGMPSSMGMAPSAGTPPLAGMAPSMGMGQSVGAPPSMGMAPSMGMPPSVAVPAAPKKSPLVPIFAAAGGLVALLVIVLAARSCGKALETKVYVECKDNGIDFSCLVTHQQGSSPAGVCWDVKVSCANGAIQTAPGCQNVQPSGKASMLVPSKLLAGPTCDKRAGISVENIKLGPVYSALPVFAPPAVEPAAPGAAAPGARPSTSQSSGGSAPSALPAAPGYMLVPETIIELKPPPGWLTKQKGTWGLLLSPDGHALLAFSMFEKPAEQTAKLNEVGNLLGVDSPKWQPPRPKLIGPDKLPAQAAEGACKFPSGEGVIAYANVTTGVPRKVLVVYAVSNQATEADREQALSAVGSMRKKK